MFDAILRIVVWSSFGLIAYAYLVYPALIWCCARWFGKKAAAPRAMADAEWPSVALLIAAHNEEAVIEQRVRNALAADYPAGKLQIVVASDGSTDRTAQIVNRFADRGVRLLDYRPQRGKAAVLESAMAAIDADIVVLSDANTCTDPAAMRKLARWFADPAVGVVCGRLIIKDPATGTNADGLYWRYETFMKKCESRLGALLGSNGAIYAIRRSQFAGVPQGVIVDDFVIPLLMKLRHGCSIIYDADAIAEEESAPDVAAEFHRRTRIGAGGFQAIGMLWPLLNPRHGWIAFAFLSHKVLRWLCPFFMLGTLIGSAILWRAPLFRSALLAQLIFYLGALGGSLVRARVKALKPLRVAGMFVSMNAAILCGFGRWVRGRQSGIWNRTARTAEINDHGGAAHAGHGGI